MPDLTFPSGPKQLGGYLAVPEGDGPWPGVVMLQDILGLTDDLRRLADHMAAAGYLVLAPDLYSGGVRISCVRQTVLSMIRGKGPAFAHIEAARDYVTAHPDSTGKVGVIGFCMGGGFALGMASGHSFDAAATNYGLLPNHNVKELVQGACPIVGSFGGSDPTIPPFLVRRLERSLTEAGVPHDVKIYPNVSHSFFQNYGGAIGVITKVTGMSHKPEACEDAWERIFTFFGAHLATSAPTTESATAGP